MIFYTVPYIIVLSASFLSLLAKAKNSSLIVLAMFPAFLIVVLRGDVGTDTASYIQILDSIRELMNHGSLIYDEVEVGFNVTSAFILSLGYSSRSAVLIISGFLCLLSIFAFTRSRNDALVFSFLILPVFFYDMSMNGLRYGIAFCLVKIAIDALEQRKNYLSALFLICALSFHVSALILFSLLILRSINAKLIVVLFLLGLLGGVVASDRLMLKLSVYSNLTSPGELSGLYPLLIFILIYLTSVFGSRKDFWYLSLLLILEFLFFLMARFSYAGLRLQFLTLFALCCSVPSLGVMHGRWRQVFLLGLMLVGLLGFAGKLRNMNDGIGVGESPFLPYHFFWEAR